MLLVITNSQDATADFLCSRLDESNIAYYRIDSDHITQGGQIEFRDFQPILIHNGQRLNPTEFHSVWLRRPKPIIIENEELEDPERLHVQGEWSEAIEGFLAHIPFSKWINHPTANVVASHKIEQLSRAKSHGLVVPDSLVTQNTQELRNFWQKCDGQLIVKPLCSGYIERQSSELDSLIYTNSFPPDLLASPTIQKTPTLFQRRIDKSIDVRVTIVDTYVHAVSLSAADQGSQRLDIRRNNMSDVTYAKISLPTPIASSLSRLITSYSLRFAAVDFVVDKNGEWNFLEINPNGQWAWLDLAGCTDIAASFLKIFRNEQ